MTESQTFVVRPSSKPSRADFKGLFRIYISPSAILRHKFKAGSSCHLNIARSILGTAVVWPAQEKIQDSVVQISKPLQTLCGLKLGDKISLLHENAQFQEAKSIVLSECVQVGEELSLPPLNEEDRLHWAWMLTYIISQIDLLSPGLLLEDIEVRGEKRTFKIKSINLSTTPSLFEINSQVETRIDDIESENRNNSINVEKDNLEIRSENVGGLEKQIKLLNEKLRNYKKCQRKILYPQHYRPRRGGIILHGPSGTGKSLILDMLAMAGWNKVFYVTSTISGQTAIERKATIASIFLAAQQSQPSLIVIDKLDLVARKPSGQFDDHGASIAFILHEEFERLKEARILVIAATNHLSHIDPTLRGPGKFECEVEFPAPDVRARAEILKTASGLAKNGCSTFLDGLANRTHGYVGADLDRLVQTALDKALARIMDTEQAQSCELIDGEPPLEPSIVLEVTATDYEKALHDVRPTAMQEIFLETPKVKWTDIGGQYEAKRILAQAIEWPFKYHIDIDRLGIDPKKGLLLYGPPGCSKTLIAKAVATEASLNFLAVKGAELLSMYVGESERSIREIFSKARAASPSVIFIDEIDAIGASRSIAGQHEGLNVLTTLLNELDGIEVLKGVFVLAATNKPQILDPALMRPGRLDTLLYIGLPELETRLEIIKIKTKGMDIDDNLDIARFATQTDGYSGAEIASICQKAGFAALEEQISTGSPQKIANRHLEIALLGMPKQITHEMIKSYSDWQSHIC